MSIYVTGDTHGNIDFAKLKVFARNNPQLTKADFMIIAGDFGAVWSEKTLEADLKLYSNLPFTVLFVDGNHENFELLSAYPVEEWHGGKVRFIKPDIIHLMRGQVFEIEGKTFFTFGGATSHDKDHRIKDISWWSAEAPTYVDYDEALKNLERYDFKVDYIITHTCDERALHYSPLSRLRLDVYHENQMLSNFEDLVKYTHWYFGHYHTDGDISDKKTVLYNEIRKLT